MNQPLQPSMATQQSQPGAIWLWGLLIAAVVVLVIIFRQSLALMVEWWDTPEYSHGYMIPLVAFFLLWQRLNKLPAATERGSWWGVILVIAGLAAFLLGELSAIYTVIQYGFLIALFGLALTFFGGRSMRLLWVVFVYLIFMIPLPSFLYFNLSSQLQLLSSQIGVAVIRLFGISVFLEGNVIDLGSMQLQVAEACSGMRYLFPLMSFGFLIAYLYRGPFWQRATIFLTTIPITIFMNSFRIGVIGITVDRWGKAMAEGFLHDFEGWVVFMGCLSILFLEITIFHLINRDHTRALDRLNLDTPALAIKLADFHLSAAKQRPFLISVALLVLLAPILVTINERPEITPERKDFAQFPLSHNSWVGRTTALDPNILGALKLTDYIQADYLRPDDRIPVNLYVAWYATQKKGASIHSPRSCIPGGGWRVQSLEQRDLASVSHVSGKPLRVNRALIQKGNTSEIVYYWFEGRGRDVTNEYLAKWYIFWDALTRSRTDGALIRLIAYVPDPTKLAAADEQLEQFARDFYPLLPSYAP
ncbi:MAG TPA: VPLPA-CTERM-specific exosortase XrtD [Spongiibacteraceae bacterium]|nr:VPLPA-CTERM-specific exosortase XrtD [Spongiibacteraceae bacterium]